MDMKTFIEMAVALVPVLIQAGQSTIAISEKLYEKWKSGDDVTAADEEWLQALTEAQTAVIQSPIPGEE